MGEEDKRTGAAVLCKDEEQVTASVAYVARLLFQTCQTLPFLESALSVVDCPTDDPGSHYSFSHGKSQRSRIFSFLSRIIELANYFFTRNITEVTEDKNSKIL